MNSPEFIRCYLSEIGHNNFWYPTETQALLSKDCKYDTLHWITGNIELKLKAIKVCKSCILPLNCDPETIDSTAPPQEKGLTVVWINK